MRELQKTIIDEMGVKPTIDPAAEVERRVQFLCDYLTASHTKGFVLGISGGIDSTLAGRLAQLAVERLRSEGVEADFVAIRLPHGVLQPSMKAQPCRAAPHHHVAMHQRNAPRLVGPLGAAPQEPQKKK